MCTLWAWFPSCRLRYQSLFSLCDSIYSVIYLLFENREFPYFHPLLCCHHKHVLSLFSSPLSSLWQVQQTSWSASNCFLGGSGQVCHSSWGSPYSRGWIESQFQTHAIHPKIKPSVADIVDGRFLQAQWPTSSFWFGLRAHIFRRIFQR